MEGEARLSYMDGQEGEGLVTRIVLYGTRAAAGESGAQRRV